MKRLRQITNPIPCDEVCFGMDVPINPWTAKDVAFWTQISTGTIHYEPWRDVAAFFKGSHP